MQKSALARHGHEVAKLLANLVNTSQGNRVQHTAVGGILYACGFCHSQRRAWRASRLPFARRLRAIARRLPVHGARWGDPGGVEQAVEAAVGSTSTRSGE